MNKFVMLCVMLLAFVPAVSAIPIMNPGPAVDSISFKYEYAGAFELWSYLKDRNAQGSRDDNGHFGPWDNIHYRAERGHSPVPEPATMMLLETGLIMLGTISQRKLRTVGKINT